jgi:hypothetical protein
MDTRSWTVVSTGIDGLNLTATGAEGKQLLVDCYDQHRTENEGKGWLETEGKKGNYQTLGMNGMMLGVDPMRGNWLSTMGQKAQMLPLQQLSTQSGCTRCDLQVTMMLNSKCGGLASTVYQKLTAGLQSLPSDPYLALIQSSSGSTLYYGKRTNGFMIRLYDKGAQTGLAEPGYMWRLEIEYRKKQAESIWKALKEWEFQPKTIGEWVISQCHMRGFPVPSSGTWNGEDPDFSVEDPDYHRKLVWLATQVKPTVEQLLEAGYGQAVRDIFEGAI